MKAIRVIEFERIASAVADLCGKAACDLPPDVLAGLRNSGETEQSELGRDFFRQYLENARIAASDRGTIYEAIEEGTRRGYKDHYLRKSIVSDPLFDRRNTFDNTPAVIHLTLVEGESVKILLAPKGGGSENMSAVKMLKPSDGRRGVVDFVVETVRNAGGNPCPPTVVGVGIGGTFEKAAYLAKHALLRPLGSPNPDPRYAELEAEILQKINATGVGPQGLGGDITSLAVHIEFHPCHLASMPVALNLNCHAARHAEVTL